MKNTQTVFDAATHAEQTGDSDKALRLYERALLLFDNGKWNEAIRVARQLTKRSPGSFSAPIVIARSYSELGRWKMAERFYRKSLAIKQEPWLWLLLGWALDRLKRHDEAKDCLRKALKVDPDYDEAHYNLGCSYRRQGKLALAEKHLKRAIEIDPQYALAYAELGQLLTGQKNRTKQAISCLRTALDYNPNDGWSIAYLANALWKLRKLKAAEAQYQRLIELWPDESLPYWSYGDFLALERNESATAEPYLRKAVEIEPHSAPANYYLGKYLLYRNRKEDARRFLAKAARLGHLKARGLLPEATRSTRIPQRWRGTKQ